MKEFLKDLVDKLRREDMNLSCVYCGKEARYMFRGTSLCKDHLDRELNSGKTSLKNPDIIVIDAPEVPE